MEDDDDVPAAKGRGNRKGGNHNDCCCQRYGHGLWQQIDVPLEQIGLRHMLRMHLPKGYRADAKKVVAGLLHPIQRKKQTTCDQADSDPRETLPDAEGCQSWCSGKYAVIVLMESEEEEEAATGDADAE